LAITAVKVKAGSEGPATSSKDNISQVIKAGSKVWLRKELSTNLRQEFLPICLQSRPELSRLSHLLAPLNVENSTKTTLDDSSAKRK
jgi:hypothetical protein